MRIAVIGVGLIGGSVGLAARERLDADVVGWDPSADARAAGCRLGALSSAAPTLAEALHDAQIAVVAAPVGVLPKLVADVLAAAPEDCAVTDVGSTKRALVTSDERFCGGHPLAGAETAGVEHARVDLFDGAPWYLTPGPRTSGVLFERLHRFVTGLGARPAAIDPETHDRMMASISHLPHVVANVMVAQAAGALGGERVPPTGPSFRDATRVAGANSAIWTDIYLGNAEALVERIDDMVERLGQVRAALVAGDARGITDWNDAAARDRRTLLESGLEGGDVHELRASVPNRPGVVAEIALALGRAGVNIVDMALSPSGDFRQGRVSLWVSGAEQAARAETLIAELDIPVARA
ncbi:MAG TPA: prephenate dehydrogenase/arogenate dehydrogenase family protein [Solirubrobacteraceae bacterium]|nr:prephenate dehydrogenase/arogenate dehydrogenase family protein [Solirubrobacteraceae bacterium]